jgi:hypothetical protein
MLGDKAALRTLREGERQGLSDYVNALRTTHLPLDCRRHIENELLPAQRRHMAQLDSVLQTT